jgi:hypothetical protein
MLTLELIAAAEFSKVVKMAGKGAKIRGFSTDVSNFVRATHNTNAPGKGIIGLRETNYPNRILILQTRLRLTPGIAVLMMSRTTPMFSPHTWLTPRCRRTSLLIKAAPGCRVPEIHGVSGAISKLGKSSQLIHVIIPYIHNLLVSWERRDIREPGCQCRG